MDVDAICKMAAVAGQLSVMDCAGVADGSAAAIVCRAEDAHRYTDKPLYVKALSFVAGNGSGLLDPTYDYTTFRECEAAANDAYAQAGITDPRRSARDGRGARLLHADRAGADGGPRVLASAARRGRTSRPACSTSDGELPVNPDGGSEVLRPPGRRVGSAHVVRGWLQLRGEAPEDRRISTADRGLALTHNLGGYPGEMVSFVGIWGNQLDQ